MTSLRKESKTTSLTTMPSDVMEHMVHMMWSRDQKALAITAKEPSIWVAKGLLYELIELLELKEEIAMPMSAQEAKSMYMDLLRKYPTHMFAFFSEMEAEVSRVKPEARVLEDRYLKHLLYFCNVNKRGGAFMLHQLVHNGFIQSANFHLANRFIAHGADVNGRGRDGNTMLIAIIRSNSKPAERLETVRLLLQNGADITLTGKDGKSALELSREKDEKIYDLLMAYIVQRRVESVGLKR